MNPDYFGILFMYTSIFPLFIPFGYTDEIKELQQLLYLSLHVNLLYYNYFTTFERRASNVLPNNTRNSKCQYKMFLDLDILQSIIAFTASLLYYLSKYGHINASCVTTAGNEAFNGRLKNAL